MAKKSFKKALTETMEKIGYLPFVTSIKSELIFIKHLENKHYLSVGFRTSRYDKNQLMASFYLSWIPIYALVARPWSYYDDVINFLTEEEREKFVTAEYYWEKTDENLFEKIIKAITFAEPRFLNQKDIYDDIVKLDLATEYPFLKEVIALFNSTTELPELKYKLSKQAVKLEPRWYQASEFIYHNTEAKNKFHPSVVERWGLQSYNIDKYAKLYGMPTEEYLNR